jgi:hypothetical protein
MNDRELLEFAEKAAGAQWSEYSDQTPDHLIIQRADGVWRKWRPLDDDGDALRLAVLLRISLFCSANNTACDIPCTDEYVWEEAIEGSAARRAIVRAAAEIGKSMEGK